MRNKDISIKNPRISQLREIKIYAALNQLNIYELNRFKKFLKSPYFNSNQNLVLLYTLLEPSLKNKQVAIPEKKEIWTQIFTQPYSDLKFRKLCSDLLRKFETFLAQESYEKNPLHRADYLLRAVNQKKLDPLVNSSIRTAKRISGQQLLTPASYYYYQYEYERSYYAITGFEVQRGEVSNVENIIENLDIFYIAEKLRYYCTVLSRQHVIAHEYDILFMDEIIKHIKVKEYDQLVPINFYYQIYFMHQEPENGNHFEKLKALIDQHIQHLPEVDAEEIIGSALNYCIRNINAGKGEFLRELFDLYQEFLNKELLFVDGQLTPWKFRNVIVTALRLGEYPWVEKFIHDYSPHLAEEYRENAITFNLANLYFYKKEYDRVLELLHQVEYEDASYNLNSKTMLTWTYYELDEIESLLSLLDSFRIFLKRSKSIPQNRKQHYLNLIRFVRKLVKVRIGDEKAIEKLKVEIDGTAGVVNKKLLLEKLEDLRK